MRTYAVVQLVTVSIREWPAVGFATVARYCVTSSSLEIDIVGIPPILFSFLCIGHELKPQS